MTRDSLRPCALYALATLVAGALAQDPTVYYDISYGSDHERQKLDLYVPPGYDTPRPVVIWIHGGGWWGGDKFTAAAKADILCPAGFAVAGINYRYSTQATFPAQIHDCKAAVRWLRAHAEAYNLEPTRFGVWGHSAGGHLAALVGTSGSVADLEGVVTGGGMVDCLAASSRVQAAADYAGLNDFFQLDEAHMGPDSSVSVLIGECVGDIIAHQYEPQWAESVALLRSASPCSHVTSDDPPFYIAHGTADESVPVEQSLLLYDALCAVGAPATLHLLEGAGHGLTPEEDLLVRAHFEQWLRDIPAVGDYDGDGAVDGADFAGLPTCMSGPSGAVGFRIPSAACRSAYDYDVDADIDLCDLARFQASLGG